MVTNSAVELVLSSLFSPSSAMCGVNAAISERHLGRRMNQVQLQQPEPGMHSSPPPSSTCRVSEDAHDPCWWVRWQDQEHRAITLCRHLATSSDAGMKVQQLPCCSSTLLWFVT